jgi:ABC-type multidrug transport system fused ATPase/permease subunit
VLPFECALLTQLLGRRKCRPGTQFWTKYVLKTLKSQYHIHVALLTFEDAAQVTAAANRILEARLNQNKDIVADTEQIPDTVGGVEIELQDVYFRYPTRDISIFKGLNMHVSLSKHGRHNCSCSDPPQIQKGQFAALVGASGT